MQGNNKLNFAIAKKIIFRDHFSDYELKKLKKNDARKLSALHKVAIDLLMGQIDFNNIDYIVHSSQHGELNISNDLISDLLENKTLSPTKFSQSTHNALIGNLSIFSKKKIPMSSISAGTQSLSMGLLSALTCLHSEKHKNILFIYTESSVPEKFENFVESEDIIIAIQLMHGKDFLLKVDDSSQAVIHTNTESLRLIDWDYLSPLELNTINIEIAR